VQFELQTRATAALPPEFVEEFEERFIHQRDLDPERRRRKTRKVYVRWRAAQRLILSVATDPSEWFCQTHAFYDFFYREKLTIKYANAILGLANLWGFFICRKLGRPFLPVPIPRGYERLRIFEANLDKSSRVTRASLPISPIDLAGARRGLNRSNLNWLTLSVWFGLRPKEVDPLLDVNMWRVEVLPTGRQVLWVFQTKLVGLPTEDRWKPIPILFDEQRFALEIARSGTFRRPLVKTMRRHFGDGVMLYGGRKGFTDLMLSRGQSLENISVWMGHSSIQRTWQSYKDRRRFHVAGF
jgi:integrase